MKKATMIAFGVALLATSWPSWAQNPQDTNDMQLWEFRQVLVDLGSYLDAHKGTDFQRQFATMPDNVIENWYPAVKNPREFQKAVMGLKQHDGSMAARRAERRVDASLLPRAVTPACVPNSIVDISTGALCTPAFPDPSNTSWQSMINPLIPIGAFTPGATYTDISSQGCGLTTEANLELVSVVMTGITNVGAIGCSIIPIVPTGPARAACFADLSIIALANQAANGLYSTCVVQDNMVNGAEINANFRNTVTIYNNLKGADGLLNNFFSSVNSHVGTINTQVSTDFSSLNTQVTKIGNSFTSLNNQVSTDFSSVDNHLTTVNNQVTGEFSAYDTHLTNVNNQVTGKFSTFDTHLTNVNDHVASEFTALDAHLVSLINQLVNQIGQGTARLGADAKQLMKLQLTPEGIKVLNPAILTCTGTNCPNVLAACPAAGCSWNNVGPLP